VLNCLQIASVPSKRIIKVCMNVHHSDHCIAVAIFANVTYYCERARENESERGSVRVCVSVCVCVCVRERETDRQTEWNDRFYFGWFGLLSVSYTLTLNYTQIQAFFYCLRIHHAYSGAAYALPEQIHYNTYIHTYCTMWGTGQNIVAPLPVYLLA
jgi:hypothetical protein